MSQRRPIRAILLRLALLAAIALAVQPALPGGQATQIARAAGSSGTITLRVTNARSEANHPVPAYLQPTAGNSTEAVAKDQPIRAGTHYTWIINKDNVGDPTQPAEPACRRTGQPGVSGDAAYPANCDWPAIRAVPGASPVVAQGDESTLGASISVSLPNGK